MRVDDGEQPVGFSERPMCTCPRLELATRGGGGSFGCPPTIRRADQHRLPDHSTGWERRVSGGMAMSLGTILCLAGSAALVWYGGRFCGKCGGTGPASRMRGPFKDAVKELLTDWRLRRSARGIVPLQNGLRDHAEGKFWFRECPRVAISRNVESIWNPRDWKFRDLVAGLPHSFVRRRALSAIVLVVASGSSI